MSKRLATYTGEGHWNAALTEKKVQAARELRQEYCLSNMAIAILARVKYQTIWEATTYRSWKHVPEQQMSMEEAVLILLDLDHSVAWQEQGGEDSE